MVTLPFKDEKLTLTSLISDKSSFGIVYNTNNPKYVVKLQLLHTQSAFIEFHEEAAVGTKVNPKYATRIRFSDVIKDGPLHDKILKLVYKKSNNNYKNISIGYYVIDNIVQSPKHSSLNILEYFSLFEKDKMCPSKNHKVYRLLKKSLLEFYKTGYYHGDLHLGNIYIVILKSNPLNVVNVKIIDFGMSLPFKLTKPTNCLTSILNDISSQFHKDYHNNKRLWLKNNKKRVGFITNFFNAPKKYLTNAKTSSTKNSPPKKRMKCWTTSKGKSKPYVVCVNKSKLKSKKVNK